MNFSIFSTILSVERYRQRASVGGGFSVPALLERDLPDGSDPILSTNARGSFVFTHRNSEGFARYGFSQVPLESEPLLLGSLVETLYNSDQVRKYTSLGEAFTALEGFSLAPANLILAEMLVPLFSTDRLGVPYQKFEKVRVLRAPQSELKPGVALLVSSPESLGVYTRVGDYLGIQLFNIHRTIALVSLNELVG